MRTGPNSRGLLAQVAEHRARAELAHRHREVDAFHLRADRAIDGEIALVGAEDLDLVAAHVERGEERHGIDMVPVRVRDEDAPREALDARSHDVVGQTLDARTAIEDVERLAADFHAHAGRVAAVAGVRGTGRGQGAVHAPVPDHHAAGHDIGDRLHQRFAIERLGHEAVGAELARAAPVEIVGLGREHDDLHVGELGTPAQLARELEAVHLGHHDVGDDAVGARHRDLLERLQARRRSLDLMAGILERLRQHRQDVGIIVDQVEVHSPKIIRRRLTAQW